MNSKGLLHNKILGLFVKTNGLLSKPFFSGLGHILVLHRVHPPIKTFFHKGGMEIWPENLEKIIQFFINKGFDTISMDEVFNRLRERKKGKKFVAFTLDDGYTDNHDVAWPIFKKNHVPFTVFITTDFPDRKAIMWWYLLEDKLMNNTNLEFIWEDKKYRYNCTSPEEKENTFFEVRSLILSTKSEEFENLLDAIFDFDKIDKFNHVNRLALSWEQIREMNKDPLVSIGAHTTSHCNLKKLNKGDANREIIQSKKLIEEHIGSEVNHFAYPYGTLNEAGEREFEMIRKAGFWTATTLVHGNIFPGHLNFLDRLPRIPLGNHIDEIGLNYIVNGVHQFGYNYFKKIIVG